MLGRILVTALVAGIVAGLAVSLFQAIGVTPLILEAETFEMAAGGTAEGHDHGSHDHEQDGGWMPAGGAGRIAWTVVANLVTGAGFGMLLAGAIALAGRRTGWHRGLLWGLAGYAVFAIAPSLGLPPDPPGVYAGPVGPRQIWWLGTTAATGLGLALLVFGRGWLSRLAGVLLLVAPHVVGAPHVDIYGSGTPDALIDRFILTSLATTGLFWLVLGGVAGETWKRLGRGRGPGKPLPDGTLPA